VSSDNDRITRLVDRALHEEGEFTVSDVKALLRACFTAPPGYVLLDADLNAVEPRTVSWSVCDWASLAAFDKGDPYSDAASTIFNRPRETIKKGSQERQLGKAQIIGCGYGLGNPEKFRALAAKAPYNVDWAACPVTPEQVIAAYRSEHPDVVQLWADMQNAAVAACDGYTTAVGNPDAPFVWGPSPLRPPGTQGPDDPGDVWMMLPSGRPIVYYKMSYTWGRRGPEITFQGRKGRTHVYGGLFLENAIQALDRDVLGLGVVHCETGWDGGEPIPVVLTAHDAIIGLSRREEADRNLARMMAMMTATPDFTPGLLLKAEGFWSERHRK
jgi:DNA polymerase